MYAMLDQSAEGRELFAIMQKSKYEIINEWFEDERVRLHLLRIASENLVPPEEKATGIGVFFFLGFLEKHGLGVPVGGSGALTAALVRCIEDRGGTVIPSVDIDRVIVKDGRAVGVHATDGREFSARDAVIGAIHPHLLGDMVAGLDPKLVEAARRTKTASIACFTIHAALNAPLEYKAGERVTQGYMIELLPSRMEAFRRHFDDLRYGRLPDQPLIGLGSPSVFDPGRVPSGKATMHAWDYVPYEHPAGGAAKWDDNKKVFAERMLERMSGYISNLDDIASYHADSPLDMERTSASFRRGDLAGIAPNAYQFGAHRPIPELGQFTVPGVEGLYLVGPFQHPGGGVHGGGRATAIKMFDDLKLNFDKIGQRK
jgi:phytoene dehydrogenase-like protein